MQVKFLIATPSTINRGLVLDPKVKIFFDANVVTLAVPETASLGGLWVDPESCLVFFQSNLVFALGENLSQPLMLLIETTEPNFTLHINVFSNAGEESQISYEYPAKRKTVKIESAQFSKAHKVSVASTVPFSSNTVQWNTHVKI